MRNENVIEVVAQKFNISVRDITGSTRTQKASDARHLCMLILSDAGEYNSEIAAYFNLTKDSVRYGIRVARNRIETQKSFKSRYLSICEYLGIEV